MKHVKLQRMIFENFQIRINLEVSTLVIYLPPEIYKGRIDELHSVKVRAEGGNL
jgi:hypothetical protein